jgi:hypothetical protein
VARRQQLPRQWRALTGLTGIRLVYVARLPAEPRVTPCHSSSPNVLHHGEADHAAYLERPFAEALAALDARGRPTAP